MIRYKNRFNYETRNKVSEKPVHLFLTNKHVVGNYN